MPGYKVMDFFTAVTEGFDLPILDFIRQQLQSPALDGPMVVITSLADAGILWILLAIILLCIPKYRPTGFAVGAALVIGLILCNGILKPLVGRVRPFTYQLEQFGKTIPLLIAPPADASFPSGHTIASFEAAVVMVLRHKKAGIPWLVLAFAIAFSRLYLYVHYPTDVLCSMVLGTGIAFLGSWLVKQGYVWYQHKQLHKS